MNKYNCLNNQEFEFDAYKVLPLREEDIFDIKNWRNSQMDVLRQNKLLTDEDQKNYYDTAVSKSFKEEYPKIILFSFLENDICIGYGGLTNIDWLSKRAEISFLLNTERIKSDKLYKESFSSFLSLMKKVTFEELKFNRLFTETFDIRPLHISILERNGFKPEGRMQEHVYVDGNYIDSLIHGFLKKYYE